MELPGDWFAKLKEKLEGSWLPFNMSYNCMFNSYLANRLYIKDNLLPAQIRKSG